MKLAPLIPAALILSLLACAPTSTPTPTAPPPHPLSTGIDHSFYLPVGTPNSPSEAKIATWVLQPPKGTPIQGTILFLHGFMANHRQLLPAAENLRKHGYRTVLVDIRGFGASSGQHITFGVLDAQDLKQVIDQLQFRKLCGPTLGVYGTSMGAGSAILYAALDPRVKAVIAVAPFATIRDTVPSFSRNVLPTAASSRMSDSQVNALANAVAALTNLDLDAAKPLDAITQTSIPILLIHGTADTIIPIAASEKLHAAAPTHTTLLPIPNRGHVTLCFDIRGELYDTTLSFFNQYLP